MADKDEAAMKALAESQEWQKKVVEQVAKNTSVRPTPTQEELDKSALGIAVLTHEEDGSPLDPRAPAWSKHEVAKPAGGGYQTRQSRPVSPTSTTPSS